MLICTVDTLLHLERVPNFIGEVVPNACPPYLQAFRGTLLLRSRGGGAFRSIPWRSASCREGVYPPSWITKKVLARKTVRAMSIRIVVGILAALAGYALFGKRKKVFVSYYYDGDRHYKRLLQAWSANEKFGLEFEDISTDVSISSENAEYIKRKISVQIEQCDVFVVFVGEETHERAWISWEIEKAKKFKKRIVAIKEKKTHVSPKELRAAGAVWVYGFNAEKIRVAIEG